MDSGGKGEDERTGKRSSSHARTPIPHRPSTGLPESEWVAWFVPTVALANAAIFVYALYLNNCPASHHGNAGDDGDERCVFPALGRFAFEPLSANPLLGPSTQTLDAMGALDYDKVVKGGEGWRFFTCIWLHAGVIHLLANILSLVFVGVRMEKEFGFMVVSPVKIGVLYAISGLGGSMASCFSIRSRISVGASGALFGFLGALLSELLTNWTIYANKFVALLTLGIVIGINLSMGFVPHVDSSAHIGGFITGFLLGFVLLIRPQYGYISRRNLPPGFNLDQVKSKHKGYQYFLWITAFVILVVWFLVGMIELYSGVRIKIGS